MPLPVTALYLAIFAVFSSVLAFLPGSIRGRTGISIGDGGRPDLLLAMRRHANFLEYVPYFMLMFAVLELNGTRALWLHVLGLGMIGARICHALGLKADTIQSPLRGIGAGGTLLLTLIATAMLGYQFVTA
jgi:uncharacterized membrane protein YecN with MAPEG domain